MAKTNKSVLYAITHLVKQGHAEDYISSELGLTKKQVLSIIKANDIKPDDQTIVIPPTVKNTMINQTSAKRNKGITIMTKEASELSDTATKKNLNQQQKDLQKGIFRPNRS